MKVLVTGATGYIGSHVAAALQGAGHDVRLLIRDADKAHRVLDMVDVVADDVVVGDVTDPTSVEAAVDGCDAVVHTAAIVALNRSLAAAAHATNTTATSLVLGTAARLGCDPIVHVSSVSVLEPHDGVVDLGSRLRCGASGYSASKVDSEWMARGMQAARLPVVTVYPSGVIGPDAPSLTLTHTAAQTWIRVVPAIPSGVNLIDVRDLASMIAATVEAGQGPRRIMAGGHFTRWRDLIDDIERLRGHKIVRYPVPGAVLRGIGRVMDVVKLPLPIDFELTHETMTEATKAVPCDSRASEQALGITLRPLPETLVDTYRWLVEVGGLSIDEIGYMAP